MAKKRKPPSEISIHASLAGGDKLLLAHVAGDAISIHASLAGGDI